MVYNHKQSLEFMEKKSPVIHVTISFEQIQLLLNQAKNPHSMKTNFRLVFQPDMTDDSQPIKQLQSAFEGLKVSDNDTTKTEEKTESKKLQNVLSQQHQRTEAKKQHLQKQQEKSKLQTTNQTLCQFDDSNQETKIQYKQKPKTEAQIQKDEINKLKNQIDYLNQHINQKDQFIAQQKLQIQRLQSIQAKYLSDQCRKATNSIKEHVNEYRQSFKSTRSQYYSSNYFHVGPRYQLLDFVERLIQLVEKLQKSEQVQLPKPKTLFQSRNIAQKKIIPNTLQSQPATLDLFKSANSSQTQLFAKTSLFPTFTPSTGLFSATTVTPLSNSLFGQIFNTSTQKTE